MCRPQTDVADRTGQARWQRGPARVRRGLTWLFIEGGGITVSRFLSARALDRLQITVAPLIIGSGRPSLLLPQIERLSEGLRPRTRRFVLGEDIMVECDFDG